MGEQSVPVGQLKLSLINKIKEIIIINIEIVNFNIENLKKPILD